MLSAGGLRLEFQAGTPFHPPHKGQLEPKGTEGLGTWQLGSVLHTSVLLGIPLSMFIPDSVNFVLPIEDSYGDQRHDGRN
jgi:hypothetical protein